jgi:ribosomal protein S9
LFYIGFLRNFTTEKSKFREMITKEQVESFLEELHTKMKIFGILFRDDREKNRKTLQELEIVPSYRKVIIENLCVEDYVQGPVVDELNRLGEMWAFGKDVKGREIYIKVMISGTTSQTICISFHFAEHSLVYPFKEK